MRRHLAILVAVFTIYPFVYFQCVLADETQVSLEEVLVTRAQESLANGKPLATLQALSEVGADSERPAMLEIVRQALIMLAEQTVGQATLEGSVAVFRSSDVKGLVTRTEARYPEVKDTLVVIYTWLLSEAVLQDNAGAARDYYNALEQRLSASSPVLNEIRLRLALGANSAQMRQVAREVIDRMAAENLLSPYMKFRLFMKGYYSGLSSLSILWLGFVAVVLAWIFVRLKAPGSQPQVRLTKREKRGYQNPAEQDEYSRLMAILGVDDSMNEEDLKSRYRELMRQHHPDAQAEPGALPVDGNRFREIKNAYDRLLEIRRHRFGNR